MTSQAATASARVLPLFSGSALKSVTKLLNRAAAIRGRRPFVRLELKLAAFADCDADLAREGLQLGSIEIAVVEFLD